MSGTNGKVIKQDMKAGAAMVHIVDDMLLPKDSLAMVRRRRGRGGGESPLVGEGAEHTQQQQQQQQPLHGAAASHMQQ